MVDLEDEGKWSPSTFGTLPGRWSGSDGKREEGEGVREEGEGVREKGRLRDEDEEKARCLAGSTCMRRVRLDRSKARRIRDSLLTPI